MKIKTKLQILLGVFIAISMVIGSLFAVFFHRINEANVQTSFADTIARNIIEQRIVSDEFLLYREERTLIQWQRKQDQITELLATAENVEALRNSEYLATLRSNQHDAAGIFSRILENHATQASSTEQYAVTELERRLVGQLLIKSQNMVTAAFRLADSAREQIVEVEKFIAAAIVLSFSVLLLATYGILFLFQRSVVVPLGKLERGAVRIANGDLEQDLELKSKDELGVLADSFNTMVLRLRKSIRNLEKEREDVTVQRNRLSLVLAGIYDGVIAVDKKQRIVLANPAAEKIIGLTSDELIKKPVHEVLRVTGEKGEISADEYCDPKQDKNREAVVRFSRVQLMNTAGTERTVDLTSGAMRGQKRLGVGNIITIHDLTKEMVAERAKSKFITIAAHQLRTPLSGIRWSIEGLLREEYGKITKKQGGLLTRARKTCTLLISIVNDILNVAQIDDQEFRYTMKKTDFGQFIHDLAEQVHLEAEAKHIGLSFSVPKDIPDFFFDKRKLQIAFMNVLLNSINYTNQHGSVQVAVTATKKQVTTSIEDTGVGISKEDLEHIFTKFYRGTSALHMETTGSGLGLFLAKNIIEQHGGTISIASKLGKGTKITIKLPLIQRPAQKESAQHIPQPKSS